EPATFSVGGAVDGLTGTGLVLREQTSGFQAKPTQDGPFTIDAGLNTGQAYKVVVATQPTNPLQTCTVGAGTGTIAQADITNIGIHCTTPPSGSLDASFGSNGRVTAPLENGATAVAVQADGKIVVGGESKILRFNVDGSVDSSFGTAGQADF